MFNKKSDKREDFLFEMYKQMFNDIDRHHKIVWQIIGVLAGSFALLSLTEKQIISVDLVVLIVILFSTWIIAHVYDSNYWYNRNLVIISNIERQFLKESDLKEIHYYFGEHRSENAIQTSLKIQLHFCYCVITVFVLYHIINRKPWLLVGCSEWIRFLVPYVIVAVSCIFYIYWIKNKREKNYLEFLSQSPGRNINTTSVEYGDGHPIHK